MFDVLKNRRFTKLSDEWLKPNQSTAAKDHKQFNKE